MENNKYDMGLVQHLLRSSIAQWVTIPCICEAKIPVSNSYLPYFFFVYDLERSSMYEILSVRCQNTQLFFYYYLFFKFICLHSFNLKFVFCFSRYFSRFKIYEFNNNNIGCNRL